MKLEKKLDLSRAYVGNSFKHNSSIGLTALDGQTDRRNC